VNHRIVDARQLRSAWRFALPHQHHNSPSKTPFVVPERLRAIAREVQVRKKLHSISFSFP
jgi:hypothetical protein